MFSFVCFFCIMFVIFIFVFFFVYHDFIQTQYYQFQLQHTAHLLNFTVIFFRFHKVYNHRKKHVYNIIYCFSIIILSFFNFLKWNWVYFVEIDEMAMQTICKPSKINKTASTTNPQYRHKHLFTESHNVYDLWVGRGNIFRKTTLKHFYEIIEMQNFSKNSNEKNLPKWIFRCVDWNKKNKTEKSSTQWLGSYEISKNVFDVCCT